MSKQISTPLFCIYIQALFLSLVFPAVTFAQRNEFKVHANGFIYSDTAMNALRHTVDSLHLRYKICDPNKKYFSLYQAMGCHASFTAKNDTLQKDIISDMDKGTGYEEMCRKYGDQAKLIVPIVRYVEENYRGSDTETVYRTIDKNENSISLNGDLSKNNALKGKWIYYVSKYDKNTIKGFYFLSDFISRELPSACEKMVQYGECMVDTSSQLMLGKYSYDRWGPSGETSTPAVLQRLFNLIRNKNKEDDSSFKVSLKKRYAIDANLQAAYQIAYQYLIDSNKYDYEVREFAETIGKLKDVLELERRHRVMGYCSMDQGPRLHAQEIAVLAAESNSWNLFLRSHLDIMNDRFARMSDGSYAWKGRKTYIGELEALDIDLYKLMFGISMRVENPAQNHYYGSIQRLGRALAETKDPDEFEKECKAMIADTTLDGYNRGLITWLYGNYIYNSDVKKANDKLKEARIFAKTQPAYIRDIIMSWEERKEQE